MTLTELLLDEKICGVLSAHWDGSDTPDFKSLYAALAKQLESARFVVPVFGVQGSGKSTFLNALLFDRPILPVDADETTCVPVEISWSSNPSKSARVLYDDQREISVPADDDHLREFVDNTLNPGNERGVIRVVLESDCELLRSGMVLVDLPGIGSLTHRNAATTNQFLQESIGVVFMLRTTPPITRSDSIAIQLVWPRLTYAFFIQNRWNDEPLQEAEEGVAHNVQVLREIAGRVRVPVSKNGPPIHLVNAYQAWEGKLRRKGAADDQSGLLSVFDALKTGVADWPNVLARRIALKVELDLDETRRSVFRKIENLTMTQAQLEQEMAAVKVRFDKYIHEVRLQIESAQDEAEACRKKLKKDIQRNRSSIRSDLRNTMRTKMRAGIVDGKRLESALSEEQRISFDDVVAKLQEELISLADKLRSKLAGVTSWKDVSFRHQTVNVEERAKWESLLEPAGGLGGAIVGTLLVTALVSGPPGWVVAGIAVVGGTICAFLGSWLGKKGGEAVLDQRIKEVEPKVFKAIDVFVDSFAPQLDRTTSEFIDEINHRLDRWVDEQVTIFDRRKAEQMAAMRMKADEKNSALRSLEADGRTVDEYLKVAKNL